MAEEIIEEGEDSSEEEGSPKKNLLPLIIVGGGVFFLLLSAVVGYWFFFRTEEVGNRAFSQLETEFQAISQQEAVRLNDPLYVDSQVFTVNLIGGQKYLRIALSFALEDAVATLYLTENLPMLEDQVLSVIQELTVADLRSRAGIELLKLSILRTANSIFTNEFIEFSEKKDRLPVKRVLIRRFFLN